MSIMTGYLTRQQLAEELSPREGRPLDPRTIARLEREGLPYVTIAGCKLYPATRVQEWLRERETSAAA